MKNVPNTLDEYTLKLVEPYEKECGVGRTLDDKSEKYNEQLRECDLKVKMLEEEEKKEKDIIQNAYNQKRFEINHTYTKDALPVDSKKLTQPNEIYYFKPTLEDYLSGRYGCLLLFLFGFAILFSLAALFTAALGGGPETSEAWKSARIMALIGILAVGGRFLFSYIMHKAEKKDYLKSLQEYEENKQNNEKNSQLMMRINDLIQQTKMDERIEIAKCAKKYADKIQQINNLKERIFAAAVEEYSEKAILASEGYHDLIDYSVNIFMKIISMQTPKADERMINADLTFWVHECFVEYQNDAIAQLPKYLQLDMKLEQFIYSVHGKKNIVLEAERHGLAWALSTLIIKKMNDIYPDGSVEAHRRDNQVLLKYSACNPNYLAPQKWV